MARLALMLWTTKWRGAGANLPAARGPVQTGESVTD